MSLGHALKEQHFPFDDIQDARDNAELQAETEKQITRYKKKFQGKLKCQQCSRPGTDLAWFYFSSPSWTWQELCGRAGPMAVCDHCKVQVAFFLDVMN